MVYFLNLDGTMTLAEPQRVFQGSNNVNTVYVLSAIAPPTALEISFTLPSGLTTAYYPMIYNGQTDEYTVPNTTTTVYLRSFLLTSNITAEVGTVGVSVNAVYSNADGTTGNQTSFTGSFNVEYSSIPETVTTGTADELQQALDLLSQYYTQQQAIITGGTNGEYLQSQGNNQLPVWTSFDMDFVTANRAQSFSEEQQAQVRENINAQETINLTPNLAVVSNADGTLTTAEATTEEVNYLSGVTSNLQTQINEKQATLTFDDTPTSGSDNPVTSDGINTFVGEQINGNCVLFNVAQSLTEEQQLQARQNIGADGSADNQYFVSVLPQTFTTEQQAQATANINACSTNGTYPNLTAGTATNATNATNDGNGDNIEITYAKQNGTYQNLKAGSSTSSEESNALNRTYYANLNNATEGGTLFYGNSSSSNQNTANTSAFAGQVFQGGTVVSSDYLAQKAIHYGGAIAGADNTVTREYVRGKIGRIWQNWQEIPSIVKDWESSDKLSWYRIWSDGLKECGGTMTTNNGSTPLTVALPINFSSATSYFLVTGVFGAKSNQVACVKIIYDSLTSSSFQVLGTYAADGVTNYYNNKFYYYCRGY